MDPLDPVSKLLMLLDPSVDPRMLKRPFLPKEKRPRALRSAVFMVPTDDSVAADMDAARVLVLR